jgi:hypothetical protein
MHVFVKASSSAARGKIKVSVKYSDSTQTGKISQSIVTAADYSDIPDGYVIVSANVSKIKFSILHTSKSGKVYVDDVSLLYTSGGGLRMKLLPLP